MNNSNIFIISLLKFDMDIIFIIQLVVIPTLNLSSYTYFINLSKFQHFCFQCCITYSSCLFLNKIFADIRQYQTGVLPDPWIFGSRGA